MNTAVLYYPHSELLNEEMLKTGLLLWDHVDVIVPSIPGYDFERGEGIVRDAVNALVHFRSPTFEEQEEAHEQVMAMLEPGIPDWLIFDPMLKSRQYEIYESKLLPETWNKLYESGLAQCIQYELGPDGVMHPALGLAVMGVLARVCAGKTKQLVTDEPGTFESSTRMLTERLGGTYGNIKTDHRSRLVKMAMLSLDVTDISLERLVSLRAQEVAFTRRLRDNFRKKVDDYQQLLAEDDVSESDRQEYERNFRREMKDDLAELTDQLGHATDIRLREGVLGSILTAVAGSPGKAIGNLAASIPAGRQERMKSLREHPAAWLYCAQSDFQWL